MPIRHLQRVLPVVLALSAGTTGARDIDQDEALALADRIVVLQAGLAQVGASQPTKRIVTGVGTTAAAVIDAARHRPR